MVKVIWKVSALPRFVWTKLKWKWTKLRISRLSLFYNHYTNRAYVIDVLMEPMFWFVDNFTRVLGPIFVMCVWLLTTSVVTIAYWIGIPYYWQKSPELTIFLMVFGHWILLNVVFHYYMAATTSPGQPPEGILIPEAASMCRSCIAPKPPRSHHCSICNKCILKMDHHCPWLDACVGHWNHRYFYMYMVYVVLGVAFLIAAGLEIAYTQVWLEPDEELTGHPVRFNNSVMFAVTEVPFENEVESDDTPRISLTERRCIIYMALLCASVFLALGSLSVWHGWLISRGETSIEKHINISETKRLKKMNLEFRNPYNFGIRRNWQLFLGLVDGRSWRHVLLPSTHPPVGDGMSWVTIYSHLDGQAQAPTEVTAHLGEQTQMGSPTVHGDAIVVAPVFHRMNVKKRAPPVEESGADSEVEGGTIS